jgi:hypothetical protein
MGAGAAILLLVGLLVMLFGKEPSPDAQLVSRTQRLELVGRMQLDLVSASEAEKSAVLAISDQESQAFADQARSRAAAVERERRELEALVNQGGSQAEKDLLAEFAKRFSEFQRIDEELLSLAVRNTNREAYALSFGPAAAALDEMSAALSRLVTANADAPDARKVMSFAFGAQIGALRIQTLLPPHVAEASDARMDELEARMSREGEQVRSDLDGLAALPKLGGRDDLGVAAAAYARFGELESRILALSRENTNVRSLSISLNQERKVMLACHEVLDGLQEAIRKEPIAGSRFGPRPAGPE